MRCNFPLPALYSPSGLTKVAVFPRYKPEDSCHPAHSASVKPRYRFRKDSKVIYLRCGKCLACKVTKSEEWAVRCVHEAREHQHNMFVTLTYSPDKAPNVLTEEEARLRAEREAEQEAIAKVTGKRVVKEPPIRGLLNRPMTLYYPDFQDFMKRLRKYATTHYGSEYAKRISYLVCGEYTQSGIPHFHAIIFGLRMPDMIQVGRSKKIANHNQRYKLFGSKTLESLWSHGFITIGEVNEHTSAYVAQYTTKKLRDGESECRTYTQHFNCYTKRSEQSRTETYQDGRRKEFMRCSLKKPIGMSWIIKREAIEDVYIRGRDRVVFMNKKGRVRFVTPPKFYDRICERYYPEIWEQVRANREKRQEALEPPSLEILTSGFSVLQHRLLSKVNCRNVI